MSHCEWCAEPRRANLRALVLAAGGDLVSAASVARVARSTARLFVTEARRRGCLPHVTCRHCGMELKATGVCKRPPCVEAALRIAPKKRIDAPRPLTPTICSTWPATPDESAR